MGTKQWWRGKEKVKSSWFCIPHPRIHPANNYRAYAHNKGGPAMPTLLTISRLILLPSCCVPPLLLFLRTCPGPEPLSSSSLPVFVPILNLSQSLRTISAVAAWPSLQTRLWQKKKDQKIQGRRNEKARKTWKRREEKDKEERRSQSISWSKFIIFLSLVFHFYLDYSLKSYLA